MADVKTRMAELRQQINLHNYRYYVLDSPLVSDAQYDKLIAELRQLEVEHPELVTPDSPTQRVSGQPSEKFAKVRHPHAVTDRLAHARRCRHRHIRQGISRRSTGIELPQRAWLAGRADQVLGRRSRAARRGWTSRRRWAAVVETARQE